VTETPAAPGGRAAARVELPSALRHDVRLLADVLGEILRGYGGDELLADVERLRELAIAARSGDDEASSDAAGAAAVSLIAGWSTDRAADVARAFTVYFHLANLAEEHHRVRTLRERDTDGAVAGGLASAVQELSDALGADTARDLLGALEFRPVLTAHPTEARRVALTGAIRRIEDLLAAVDDPRAGVAESAELRRRLAEEVDVLWRSDQVRLRRPDPLDEVRTALAVFDETLFRTVPVVYRELDNALQPADAGLRPPLAPAFIRLGSWIGGDRDGNPNVTAAITRQAMGIQAEHALIALERVAARIGRTLTLSSVTTPPSDELVALLGRAGAIAPDLVADLALRSAAEPHRQALLWLAARIAGTRRRDADLAYARPEELSADLAVVQESLAAAGALRQAYGELQHLRWQVETFGFHLAELEVRQHSAIHARALAELREHGAAGPGLSPMTVEVLDTIRVLDAIQRRFGPQAASRYVISFTQSAADLAAVDELVGFALGERAPDLTLAVVPLFETGEDLENCVEILESVVVEPRTVARLEASGRRFEVMLGYSDSAKDVGTTSAALILHSAQERLVDWAARHDIALTLFHGRGGALGRGGGPANRAIVAQAPGSVSGRFKVTEQGEVIFARYGNEAIARRHIEQVAAATLQAWLPANIERGTTAAAEYAGLAKTLDEASKAAFHALVKADGFADWFADVTPLDEIALLQIGSRPAKRGLQPGAARSLDDLRAIPWVFSWAQARLNLPGWYGLGSGLAAVGDLELLQRARAEWPLFTVLLENAEMSLAKADRRIAAAYLDLGDRPDLAAAVLAEYDRTREWVLKVTAHTRLLEDRRVLGRAVELRDPYVDALSFLQLRALGGLRGDAPEGPGREALQRLLLVTVNGVAAGLQNTG
jgi:phosphoenolpyruvate carboxylase